MELSRSTWLITSLSPGNGETMSRHGVPAGDVAALLGRFADLRAKALARTGQRFGFIVIHEAGLDGFWLHRVLEQEGIESHVVDPASVATSQRLIRVRKVLTAERVRQINRIKSLLFGEDRVKRDGGRLKDEGRLSRIFLNLPIPRT